MLDCMSRSESDWKLDELLKQLEREIEARERAAMSNVESVVVGITPVFALRALQGVINRQQLVILGIVLLHSKLCTIRIPHFNWDLTLRLTCFHL